MRGFVLIAILAGLVKPEWIRSKRAFGWSIILLLVTLLLDVLPPLLLSWWAREIRDDILRAVNRVDTSLWSGTVLALASLTQVGCLLRAFWPGGKLLSVKTK